MAKCDKCSGFMQLEKHPDSSCNHINVNRCLNCGKHEYVDFKPSFLSFSNVCVGCGKEYFVVAQGRKRSKFCTRACNYIYIKERALLKENQK